MFELLSTIQQSHIPLELHRCSNEEREAMADFNAKQSKSAKIEEWKSISGIGGATAEMVAN